MVRLSKSSLNRYRQCPRGYQLDHDPTFERPEPEDGSPLRIGLDVHEIYEWYYKQDDAKKIKEPYDVAMWRILSRHPLSLKYMDFCDAFVDWNLTMLEERGVPGYMPLEIESKLYDPDLDFVGIIDVVFETNDGLALIDYKTGKPKGFAQYRPELVLYKILYEKQTGREIKYLGIFFPKTGDFRMGKCIGDEPVDPNEKMPVITLDDEFEMLAVLDEVREGIEKEIFPPIKGFLCNYCDHQDYCRGEGYQNM